MIQFVKYSLQLSGWKPLGSKVSCWMFLSMFTSLETAESRGMAERQVEDISELPIQVSYSGGEEFVKWQVKEEVAILTDTNGYDYMITRWWFHVFSTCLGFVWHFISLFGKKDLHTFVVDSIYFVVFVFWFQMVRNRDWKWYSWIHENRFCANAWIKMLVIQHKMKALWGHFGTLQHAIIFRLVQLTTCGVQGICGQRRKYGIRPAIFHV